MKWDYEMASKIDIPYLKEALEVKKWAFAADVVRLYALYRYGGVYMDADIFVTDRFDDYMNSGVHFFQEYHKDRPIKECIDKNGKRVRDKVDGCGIQAAFIISEKGHPYIKSLLDGYYDKHFELNEDGKIRPNELIAPDIYAIGLEKYGYTYFDVEQNLGENAFVHPSCYVAGGHKELTTYSFAIHQCSHSWFDYTPIQKFARRIKRITKKMLYKTKRKKL